MAYGIKYELFFSDIEGKKLKIEILQKDFIIDPFNSGTLPTQIIGTGQPCLIEWDADDDIYSPIIGSRCTLNFFVTDSTIYDDFYKSDEREYKVKILSYTSYGSDYDDEELPWDGIDQNWNGELGASVFYNAIWEGFIVVDRYQEAVISNPFQISIEAIDGLGTLDSFNVPISDSTSVTENLFFYLKDLLKLTGHSFDINIANDTRKVGGNANDTIFHDMIVNKYALSNQNLTLRNSKDILEGILKATNSRIFQSNASWYIINNSSIIDHRINQSTTAGSGADDPIVPSTPTAGGTQTAPVITIIGVNPMIVGASYSLVVQNTGTVASSYVWTLPDSSTITQNSGDSGFGTLSLGIVSSSNDTDVYSVLATDANSQTDTDHITLNVDANPDTATTVDTGEAAPGTPDPPIAVDQAVYFKIELTAINSVTNSYISPLTGTYNYPASSVGGSFSMTFDIVSLGGEFTSASQINSFSVTGGFTITKALVGEFVRLTVSGTLPTGGHIGNVSASGASDVQQFTHTYSITDSVTDAVISPSTLTFTGGEGKNYSSTFTVTANSNFQFIGIGAIQVLSASNTSQILSVAATSSTVLTVTVSGTLGVTDKTNTLTVSGAAESAAVADALSISPSGVTSVAQNGGYFDVSITANGNFTISKNRDWIRTGIVSGSASTSTVRVYFDENFGTASRSGTVSFYSQASNTLLASIRLNQDGVT